MKGDTVFQFLTVALGCGPPSHLGDRRACMGPRFAAGAPAPGRSARAGTGGVGRTGTGTGGDGRGGRGTDFPRPSPLRRSRGSCYLPLIPAGPIAGWAAQPKTQDEGSRRLLDTLKGLEPWEGGSDGPAWRGT